jgi:hypothetical protein
MSTRPAGHIADEHSRVGPPFHDGSVWARA